MTQPIENLDKLRDIDRELGERLGVQGEISWCVIDPEANGWIFDKDRGVWTRWPKFSTDGNAMLMLISLMAKRGCSFAFEMRLLGDDEMPRAFFHKGYFDGSAEAVDFKQAVALAARMALRAEAGEL